MATDCEQTRARMLELVYGELWPEARAAMDAHLAGCDACRAELSALESTRDLARRALASDVPPARAHAAILRAAVAAVPARAAAKPVAPPRSLWAWVRGKWTLPTFATVGAVAVLLLASRIFLEPEKTYDRGRQGLVPSEEGARQPAPAAGTAVEPRDKASAPPAADNQSQDTPAPAKPASSRSRKKGAAPSGGRSEGAEPARKSAAYLDDLMRAPAEAAQASPPTAAHPAAPRAFAPAPPVPKRQVSDDVVEGFGSADSAAGAGAPAPTAKKAEALEDDTLAARPPAARSAPAPAGAPAAAPARETAAARADRLFAQHRWTEAAVAYRDLLRDDPRSPEAARWRQRLAVCQAAAANDAP